MCVDSHVCVFVCVYYPYAINSYRMCVRLSVCARVCVCDCVYAVGRDGLVVSGTSIVHAYPGTRLPWNK